MQARESSGIDFPTKRSRILDPPDELATIRDERPVCPIRYTNGDEGYLVTGHRLAKAVLTDPRFGRDELKALRRRGLAGDSMDEFERACEAYGDWRPLQGFIFMNPPEHTRIRKFLAPHFTMRRMSEFKPRIEEIVTERLDSMQERGSPIDLLEAFAAPISLLSQCALLGIEPDSVAHFFRISTMGADSMTPAEAAAGWRAAWEHIKALVQEERRNPTGGVLGAIAANAEFSDDEAADTALSVFEGGLEASGDMIALAVYVLLRHPNQWEALKNDRTLVGNAVEETLRYVSINHVAVGSTALEDAELDGVQIPGGTTVTVSLAAANRDPEKFPEPDALQVDRDTGGHVAFAQGVHMCLGQHLARLELQIALNGLLQHFPTLHLAVDADDVPVYGIDQGFWRLQRLPVAW